VTGNADMTQKARLLCFVASLFLWPYTALRWSVYRLRRRTLINRKVEWLFIQKETASAQPGRSTRIWYPPARW